MSADATLWSSEAWTSAPDAYLLQRTREGLAVKKDQGVRLGRPTAIPQETLDYIQSLRDEGDSFRKIVARLNDENVPTARGGQHWYLSTVRSALRTVELDRHAAERRAAHVAQVATIA